MGGRPKPRARSAGEHDCLQSVSSHAAAFSAVALCCRASVVELLEECWIKEPE